MLDVPACAGPPPVDRTINKPFATRVFVDVIDRAEQRPDVRDIPVVSAPGLPEKVFLPVSSLSFDSREPSRIVFLEPGNSFARDRLLDVTADGRDVIDRSTGM